MEGTWHKVGSRQWWVTLTLFFLGFELLFRLKLGSVWVLAGFFVLAHQWLAVRLGHSGPDPDPFRRFLFSLYASIFACMVIFIAFSVFNIALRTINNEWQWFQLP
jgi:hypothetical protein